MTLFAVVVTANHYWLDGLGGLIALALGAGLTICSVGAMGRVRGRWERHRADATGSTQPSAPTSSASARPRTPDDAMAAIGSAASTDDPVPTG